MLRVLVVVEALILALSTTGCQSGSLAMQSAPPPSQSSASHTHGLAREAASTWEAYFSASARVLADPEIEVDVIKPYVTPAEFEVLNQGISGFREDGQRVRGRTSTRGFEVIGVTRRNVVVALVCVDNEQSQIVNEEGRDVSPRSRQREETLRLGFEQVNGRLLLDWDEKWEKASVC